MVQMPFIWAASSLQCVPLQQIFQPNQLAAAVQLAHAKGVKVYLTCNTLPHNAEMPQFVPFLQEMKETGIDAVIVADLGLLALVRRYAPDMEIHMSTQMGIVNYETANALYHMGVKRVVLARELSLEEIAEIVPKHRQIWNWKHLCTGQCVFPFLDAVCCPPI